MKSSNEEEYEVKERTYYGAMVNAWLNTKLEHDKQLLGLSVTAIGLLVTLLRTVGVSSLFQIILFSSALLFFLITVISIIYILDENSAHIEKILTNSAEQDNVLMFLDRTSAITFIIGMVLVVIIGIDSAFTSLKENQTDMSQEKQINIQPQSPNEEKYSWNGVAKLRPQPPEATPPVSNNPPKSSSNPPNTSEGSEPSANGGSSH